MQSQLRISSFKLDEWKLSGRELLLNLIGSDELFINSIKDVISYTKARVESKGFRRKIDLDGFAVTIGVFSDQKEIIVGSDRFSSELLIIKSFDLSPEEEFSQEITKLKQLVNKVATLDSKKFPSVTEFTTVVDGLPDLMQLHQIYQEIDENTFKLVDRLAAYQNEYKSSLFEKLSDFGLGLTASYAIVRVHLLKFIAILTCLDHDKKGEEVKRILLESLRRLLVDNKKAKKYKLKGEQSALPKWIGLSFKLSYYVFKFFPAIVLAFVVRTAVRFMAKRFIAGVNIDQALKTMQILSETKRDATLDQLGELVVSEKEANDYFNHVLELIEGLQKAYPEGEKNNSGILKAHVSIKVSALCCDFKPHAFDYTYNLVYERLKNILIKAKNANVFINIDAEHYSYRDLVFNVYRRILLETEELKNYDQTGIVLQAYLRDSHKHFKDILKLAEQRNLKMPIRLVKGAYWDAETIEAQAHNFEAPQFLNKEESDIRFRQLIYLTLQNDKNLTLALASHNIHDHCWAESLRTSLFFESSIIEHQCLHMTYEALSVGLGKMGWPVRNYVPVGNLLVGMAYLVRRIMENSSQVGILTIMRSHKNLGNYTGPLDAFLSNLKNHKIVQDSSIEEVSSEFNPVSPVRPYISSHLGRFKSSKVMLPTKNKGDIDIFSNIDPKEILYKIKFYSSEETKEFVNQSFSHSFLTSLVKKTIACVSAQELMTWKRNELSQLIIKEAGKSVLEALADVDEAIDFINYYLRLYVNDYYNNDQLSAKGTVGVIAPWNFPLAIPVGMSIAPLICGNRVLLKSSEKTPLISQVYTEILHDCGVPQDVFVHLPGEGPAVGSVLVESTNVEAIVFTGSKKVGSSIYNQCNKTILKDKTIKKAICELGGKNAIIVTNNCELDETVSGILYSAFAHAGQKCSACSRILISETIRDAFVERFVEAVKDLNVKSADDYSSFVNNVISLNDKQRILQDVDKSIKEANKFNGKVLVDRSREKGLQELAVGPVVIELDADRSMHATSMAQKEIFAPVVHIVTFKSLDQAVKLFNSTKYALTGGVYCQSQDDIDYLLEKLNAGNIYINRPNTGARVAIEPFGGFKMSGTGPKAGSRNYLKSFLNTKSKHLPQLEEQHKFITGSQFMFYNPHPFKLNLTKRIKIVSSFLKHVVTRYEAIFGEVSEVNKDKVKDFTTWVDRNYENFFNRKLQNHYTPGQQNFDLNNLGSNTFLLCAYSKTPSLKSLLYFSSALLSGSGVLIMCRTNEAYSFWYQIVDILRGLGVKKDNLDIYLTNVENLHLACASNVFEFQYIDANLDTTKVVLERSLVDELTSGSYLKKILTNLECRYNDDFESICYDLLKTRSFAVNVMRHGAPLELQFE